MYRIQVRNTNGVWEDVETPSPDFATEAEAWQAVKDHETLALWHSENVLRVVEIVEKFPDLVADNPAVEKYISMAVDALAKSFPDDTSISTLRASLHDGVQAAFYAMYEELTPDYEQLECKLNYAEQRVAALQSVVDRQRDYEALRERCERYERVIDVLLER